MVAVSHNRKLNPRDLLVNLFDRFDRQIQAISFVDGSVVDQSEYTVLVAVSGPVSRTTEDARVGDVHDHAALFRWDPALDERFSPVLADRDHVIGEATGKPFLQRDKSSKEGPTVMPETTCIEFRHEIVQIKDDESPP